MALDDRTRRNMNTGPTLNMEQLGLAATPKLLPLGGYQRHWTQQGVLDGWQRFAQVDDRIVSGCAAVGATPSGRLPAGTPTRMTCDTELSRSADVRLGRIYGINDEVCGWAMEAFYGGRAERRIRAVRTPVVYLDFKSMDMTANALMNTWDTLTAEHLSLEDTTRTPLAPMHTCRANRSPPRTVEMSRPNTPLQCLRCLRCLMALAVGWFDLSGLIRAAR